MRYMVLAPYSRPWDTGDCEGSGMNDFIQQSCEALAKSGNEVDVYVRKSRAFDVDVMVLSTRLRVHFLHAGDATRLSRNEVVQALDSHDFPLSALENVDQIIAHHWISAPWIEAVRSEFGGHILYFAHSSSVNPFRTERNLLHVRSELRIIDKVTWCANSTEEMSYMSGVVHSDSLFLVPPGIAGVSKKPKASDRSSSRVLFIGRKTHSKGFDLFCALPSIFPDFEFVAIGKSSRNFICDEVQQVEYLKYAELLREISKARLVVCPSRYEHFGLVPLLSICHGVPVVATARGGHTDVISEGVSGFLCNPTENSLVEAFEIASATLPDRIKQEDIARIVTYYSWERWCQDVAKIARKKRCILKTKYLDASVEPRFINGSVVHYESVALPSSVHVLLIEPGDRYRFVIEDRGDKKDMRILRVLSGIVEPSESPRDAVIRELKEELGYEAKSLHLIWHFDKRGSIVDSRYYFQVEASPTGKASQERGEEILGTKVLSREEVVQELDTGTFGYGETALVLNAYLTKSGNGFAGGRLH